MMMEAKALYGELENGGTDGVEDICSLCGDIGFRRALLLCRRCGFRLQHTYCSRLYPAIDLERWSCEWCLHEDEKEIQRRSKVFGFLLKIAQSSPETSLSGDMEKRICRRDDQYLTEENQIKTGSNYTTETRDKAAALKKNVVRCSEKNKALDRWRNLAKTKFGSCRRYKLLADVHC